MWVGMHVCARTAPLVNGIRIWVMISHDTKASFHMERHAPLQHLPHRLDAVERSKRRSAVDYILTSDAKYGSMLVPVAHEFAMRRVYAMQVETSWSHDMPWCELGITPKTLRAQLVAILEAYVDLEAHKTDVDLEAHKTVDLQWAVGHAPDGEVGNKLHWHITGFDLQENGTIASPLPRLMDQLKSWVQEQAERNNVSAEALLEVHKGSASHKMSVRVRF